MTTQLLRCSNCKAHLRPDAKFCPKCGKVFKSRSTYTPPIPTLTPRAATAPAEPRERLIGDFRIVETWRQGQDFEGSVYVVAPLAPESALARWLAIEEHSALGAERVRQFREILPHPNLAAVWSEQKNENGDTFLLVDYVPGPSLDRVPAPLDYASALPLARDLATIMDCMWENGWGLEPARFWAADSLNRFQKAFAVNAPGRLLLFDYTVWDALPDAPAERVERARRDMYWIAKTIYWIAFGEELGRRIEQVKQGERDRAAPLRQLMLKAIRNEGMTIRGLADDLKQIL